MLAEKMVFKPLMQVCCLAHGKDNIFSRCKRTNFILKFK